MEPGGADTCLNLLYRYVPPLLKGVAWGAIWLILSPDLVLAVLGQKRGEGEGEEETFPRFLLSLPLPPPPARVLAEPIKTPETPRHDSSLIRLFLFQGQMKVALFSQLRFIQLI